MGRRVLANGALALGAVLLTLTVGEVAARWVYRDLTTTSPIESWFGERWRSEHLRENSLRLREREFSWSKPEGVYRIAVVGDSYTVAMGIDTSERYPERIEAALGPGVQVLQFARPGHEIHHHVMTLRRRILRAQPDFILLQWYVNDFEIDKFGEPRPAPLLPHWRLHSWLFSRSALYTVLNQRWRVLQVRWGFTPDYADYLRARYGDPEGADSRRAMQWLEWFFDIAAQAEIPVGVVLFPHPTPDLSADYPFAFLHERVLDACSHRGIRCVDLREVFGEHDVEAIRLNPFDHHASAFAHELAAAVLVEAFGDVWRRETVVSP